MDVRCGDCLDIMLTMDAGSGSTGKAAIIEGFRFLGVEQDAAFATIARARIAAASRGGVKP